MVFAFASIFSDIRLRSKYQTLSKNDVSSMLKKKGFFSKKLFWNSEYCNPYGGFKNQYESKTINGDKVVIDQTTGLMWHQSGSSRNYKYKNAKQWINDLNSRGYAGYHDWRFPTLEEGASLLERYEKNGDLYIDPVFSKGQRYIWTGDKFGSGAAWFVSFYLGIVSYRHLESYYSVRPVRPGH